MKSFVVLIFAVTFFWYSVAEASERNTWTLSHDNSFEASGVVWLTGIKKYLVISDGQNTEREPQAMLVDLEGRSEKVYIEGLDHLNDVESIALDEEGAIYLLSSLSENKNDGSRKKMVKIVREGYSFSKVGEFSLGKALTGVNWDVEGMSIEGDTLYLGLRNDAKIMRIDGFSSLFKETQLQAAPVKLNSLKLTHTDGEKLGISDMHLCEDNWYLAAAPADKQGRKGALYRFNRILGESTLVKIIEFDDQKPEGIFCDFANGNLVVTFDHGKAGSLMKIFELQ